MAALNNEQLKKVLEQSAQTSTAVTGNVEIPAVQQTTPYTGLAGVSENTQNILGQYSAGYAPSEAVTQAQKYLSDVVSGKPTGYQSSYKAQLDDLYNQVMNREKFSYNMSADPLYQQYKDQYVNLGQQAMMDTSAQAAALTGGYGNSYAATVGNQAYQAYLQQLNDIAPDLYQMALGQYNQEGENLQNQFSMAADLENQDYSRYMQDYNNWLAEREAATNDYWNQYNADYGQYSDMLNYYTSLAAQENAQWNTDRELAYNQAMAILSTGKTPSSALLEAAGISTSDAKKLAAAYKSSGSGSSSRSSSSGSSGGSSSGSSSSSGAQNAQTSDDSLDGYAYTVYKAVQNGLARGATKTAMIDTLDLRVKRGMITEQEAITIATKLGLK